MTEEELFIKQSNLMKEALSLLDERIRRIEEKGRTKGLGAVQEQANITICIFKVRSLKNYKSVLEFISDEIVRTDNPIRHRFLLAHTRTLLDIYARFLHLLLNSSDDINQALTCIAYQLLSYKSLNQENMYKELLKMNKDLVTANPDIRFPESYAEFKWGWMVKNGLIFARRDDLLTADNIAKYSSDSISIFPAKKTYEIYSSLSELMHGNPYYHMDGATRERYWVAGVVIPYTMFIIEIIDRYTLNWVGARDFRVWMNDVKNSRPEFVRSWKGSRL